MRPLLEREAELAALEAALADAREGRGTLVLLAGEAGIGKTSIVRAFAATADVPVHVGSCEPLAVPAPLAPLHDLAAALGPRARSGRGRGARALLAEVGARGPTVLVVEDGHWADAETLDALRVAARRIEHVAAVLVLTYRDDGASAEPIRVLAATSRRRTSSGSRHSGSPRRRSARWRERQDSTGAGCSTRPAATPSSSPSRSPSRIGCRRPSATPCSPAQPGSRPRPAARSMSRRCSARPSTRRCSPGSPPRIPPRPRSAALQETRRVLREGGRVLMATWGRADQCDGATELGAVAKLLPAPPAGAPGLFALAEEGALAALLDAAGFETLVVVDVSTPLEYEDEATYLRGFGAAGPCVNAARLVGRELFDETLIAAAAPFRREDGPFASTTSSGSRSPGPGRAEHSYAPSQ